MNRLDKVNSIKIFANKKEYLYSLFFTIFTVVILYFYNEIPGKKVASCMPNSCFCESINYKSFIKQLSNTLSSFSFVYIGFFIFFREKREILLKLFAIFTIVIGFGSAFFHGTLSFLGQSFDIAGIYLLGTFISIYTIYRYYNFSIEEVTILLIIINIILDTGLIVVPELRRYIVVIVIIVGICSEMVYIKYNNPKIELKWIKVSTLLLIIAAIIWILDITKVVCYPNSILQGHALWHILTSLSIYFLYRYYISEK